MQNKFARQGPVSGVATNRNLGGFGTAKMTANPFWRIIDDRIPPGKTKSLWQIFYAAIGNVDLSNIGNQCIPCGTGKAGRPSFKFRNEKFIDFLKIGPCADFTSIGFTTLARRLSWEMAYGPIPDNHNIIRSCATPNCVHPNHMEIKAQKKSRVKRDRSKDMPGWRRLLPVWEYIGKPFDRDYWVRQGYSFCVYKVYDDQENKTYIGRTDFSRQNTIFAEDFMGYETSSRDPDCIDAFRQRPQTMRRVVLEIFKTLEECVAREEELTMELDENGVPYWKRPDSYNRNKGGNHSFGSGENNYMSGNTHPPEIRQIISEANKGNQNAKGHKKSAESIEKTAAALRNKVVLEFKGRKYMMKSVKDAKDIFGAKVGKWLNKKNETWKNFNLTEFYYWTEKDGNLPNLFDFPDIVKYFKANNTELKTKSTNAKIKREPRVSSIVIFGFQGRKYKLLTVYERNEFFNTGNATVSVWINDRGHVAEKYGMEFIRFATDEDKTDPTILNATEYPDIRDKIRSNMQINHDKKPIVFEYAGQKLMLPSLTDAQEWFGNSLPRGWIDNASYTWRKIGIKYFRYFNENDDMHMDAINDIAVRDEIRWQMLIKIHFSKCPIEVEFKDGRIKRYANAVDGGADIGCTKKVLLDKARGIPKQKLRYGIKTVVFVKNVD